MRVFRERGFLFFGINAWGMQPKGQATGGEVWVVGVKLPRGVVGW